MTNDKKQFNKGILELGILTLLKRNDLYGYSLIQSMKQSSGGLIEVKDGTLYPILYRLEDQKLITSYWETQEEGRGKPRKYYQITTVGKQRLEVMLQDFLEVNEGIHRILNDNGGHYNG